MVLSRTLISAEMGNLKMKWWKIDYLLVQIKLRLFGFLCTR